VPSMHVPLPYLYCYRLSIIVSVRSIPMERSRVRRGLRFVKAGPRVGGLPLSSVKGEGEAFGGFAGLFLGSEPDQLPERLDVAAEGGLGTVGVPVGECLQDRSVGLGELEQVDVRLEEGYEGPGLYSE